MSISAEMQRRHFSIRDLEQMLDTGIVDEDEPIELLAGDLILKSPQNPRHAALTEKIRRLLERYHGSGTHTRTHSPIEAGANSLPEPDVGVFRGEIDAYLDHHPSGQDAIMVVEVAATSQAHDRAKASIYSRAGVPVYWLVDLEQRRVEVRSQPRPDADYAVTQILTGSDQVGIPGTGQEVAVAEFLI